VRIVRFSLGARAPRAEVRSTVRLSQTQKVVALARMSDGSVWSGSTEVVVLLAACRDGS
jgi:sulfur-oxidizing protein SoxY